MKEKQPTASVILIGNELLSGRTQDLNLNYIAKKLSDSGIVMIEARIIADIEDLIIDTVNEMRVKYDYVFTTGGIGATHDDITAKSIAKAFAVDLVSNKRAVEILESFYTADKLTPTRLRMALMPKGAELIENNVTSAPGFFVENVYVMAGVPDIMRSMFDSVLPTLKHGKPIISKSVTGNRPESEIADALSQIQDKYPELDIGSYPQFTIGKISVTIVVRGLVEDKIDLAIEEISKIMFA